MPPVSKAPVPALWSTEHSTMPFLISHCVLATELYDNEIVNADTPEGQDSEGRPSFLYNNLHYLLLGTQGPDVLFYAGLWPLRPCLAKHHYGARLHQQTGREYFAALADELATIKNKREHDAFESWCFGSLAHLVLDRTCHPYTFYFSGFEKKGQHHLRQLIRHSRMETAVDSKMAVLHDAGYFVANPEDALPFTDKEADLIDRHLLPVLAKFFRHSFPAHFYRNALKTMKSFFTLINRPSGFPLRLLGLPRALKVPLDAGDDCLNLNHAIWLDPVTGTKHTESFPDLFARAQKTMATAYYDLAANGFAAEVIGRYLDECNYSGYVPGQTMVFMSPDYNRRSW